MKFIKNIILEGASDKPMLTDCFWKNDGICKPIVIYAHGFNGFKDWGDFDKIAQQFAEAGFVFIKFNFSHNGTTVEQPAEFADLEAFGNNNYTKQLFDLGCIIDWAVSEKLPIDDTNVDTGRIFLLGHSMGGGIVLLKAAEDARVQKVVTWAAIHECKTPWTNWPQEKIDAWRRSGVDYYPNGRTKQQMPLYFQLYEDFQQNRERLDIRRAVSSLTIPVMFCHGTADEAVPVDKAESLLSWQPNAKLLLLQTDHVFGRKHPAKGAELPEATVTVVKESIRFLKQ